MRWERDNFPSPLWLAAALVIIIAITMIVPRLWCGRGAKAQFDGELSSQLPLADQVVEWVEAGVDESDFHVGSEHMNGEWAYLTYQMAGLGLGQIIIAHPETKAQYLPALDRCIDRLMTPELNRFGTRQWGEFGLDALASDHGHAYLGYFNLILGMRRLIEPENPYAQLHDRLTAALARRLEQTDTMMIETFPGGLWPPDVSAVVGSIGLHQRATGADHRELLAKWSATVRERYLDPKTGLLYQRLSFPDARPIGHPCGSGTAVGMYFISFADPALSRDLYNALRKNCRRTVLGFGGAREYPPGVFGLGDVDSGPVVFGLGVTSSGFAVAGARQQRDFEYFEEFYRTAHLIGAPVERHGRRNYITGGPLGNAILLTVFTAVPPEADK